MSNLIEQLTAAGCDVDGAMERFLDDHEFYAECVQMTLEDENFALLGQALSDGDASKAFEAAHALKGVTANVGLTPLYKIVTQIVEPLRSGKAAGLNTLYKALISERESLKAISNS